MQNKKIKLTAIVLLVLGFLSIITGVSMAFFNYIRTGSANIVSVGRISFITRQTQTISLTNLFPIDPTETGIMNDATKVGTLEIEIEGDADYVDGVEYLITTAASNVHTSTGKIVPISINITVNSLGTANDNYFTARNSKNANIYKILSANSVVGDQPLLVGYIKPNTVMGTAEGIDGSITIKAYLDKNKIAISDTYDGTESDYMGTSSSWINGRTVLTTAEWNALQSTGVSFKIKVEANEGIWVGEPMYNVLKASAVMDNIASTNVSSNTGIDFSKISGDTNSDNIIDNGQGLYIRAGTENDAYPVIYYRGNVTNNNVFFAGKCWQIIRTTETGGTKLIYNGENTGTASAPTCQNATGASRQITISSSNSFSFSGGSTNSLAYSGYTYNSPVYAFTNGDYASGAKFGNGVTYDGTFYTLTGVSDTLDANHHYTCGTANYTTCSNMRYYYSYFSTYHMYVTLTNGKTIEDVVSESLENGTTESMAKEKIEDWYEGEIDGLADASKIEDTVYCNDRSIYSLGGMNPSGGTLNNSETTYFEYSTYKRSYVDHTPSVKCIRGEDAFTKESSNGNGLLNYPVGMITVDEIVLAGGNEGTTNNNYYLNTGAYYWSLSPYSISGGGKAFQYRENSGILSYNSVDTSSGLRPVVSLKNGTSITSGSGTGASPYIIK